MASKTSDTSSVDAQLAVLQSSAAVVADQIRGSNQSVYRHLAESYMWWRAASSIDGYLKAAYATTGRKYKRTVKHGINFAPLFWLTWGNYNDLPDDRVDRWSRVLNRLHHEYEANHQYHTDSVEKLQFFIDNNGGVDGLCGYGKNNESLEATDEDDEEDDDANNPNGNWLANARTPNPDTEQMLEQLYRLANSFYTNVANPATIQLGQTLPVTNDGLSVVLVRKVGTAYQLVGASSDEAMARPLAMHTYIHDFNALPHSIRPLLELISTQCLPRRLQPAYDSLVDIAAKKAVNVKAKAIRRVLYRHDQGEFILSPIRAVSGVVTIARPVAPVFENATHDIFLSSRSRRALERRLLCDHNFNLYTPTRNDLIPEYRLAGLASHVIRLQHRFAPSDFLHLDFWSFDGSAHVPVQQLTINSNALQAPIWSASLSLAWMRKFAIEFTSPWIKSHGTNIKRGHQHVVSLDFSTTALTVHYDYRDGAFRSDLEVALDSIAIAGKSIGIYVRTKDFIIAMQSISELGVVSAIGVEVSDDAVLMVFATDAAEYRVCIPTCKVDGQLNAGAFEQYAAGLFEVDESESFNDQQEGDFDEAHSV